MRAVGNVFWQLVFFYKFHRQISGNLNDAREVGIFRKNMHQRKNTFFKYFVVYLYIKLRKKAFESIRI